MKLKPLPWPGSNDPYACFELEDPETSQVADLARKLHADIPDDLLVTMAMACIDAMGSWGLLHPNGDDERLKRLCIAFAALDGALWMNAPREHWPAALRQ